MVEILPRKLVEFPGASLEQDDSIDLLDLLVGKGLILLPAFGTYQGILAHHQVTGVAGAPLAGEQISHFLYFDVIPISELCGLFRFSNYSDFCEKQRILSIFS